MTQIQKKYHSAEQIKLVRSGEDYFSELTALIRRAKHFMHLQYYIFADDSTGKKIMAELVAAAQRGVKVNVLLDSFGSAGFKKNGAEYLRNHGINIRFFSPIYFNAGLRIGRRLHHKVAVIDDIEALVGGINISDDYYGRGSEPAWLDFAVYVRGDVCRKLTHLCNELLNNKIRSSKKVQVPHFESDSHIRVTQSDYIRGRRHITVSYRRAIKAAREEITIINAYFLPGIRLKGLLQKAAKRKVRIRLILSARSDVPLVKSAMNYYYAWLIRNNIEVYEYHPALIHAKAAVFDKSFTTIGSFNLNFLSEYISIELNADISDKKFSAHFDELLSKMINNDCTKVVLTYRQRINLWSRFIDTAAYHILSFSQSVLFFFTRKDKVNEIG